MSDYRRGLDWWLDFTDHFNTQLVITINYSAIADLLTLQTTKTHAKSFKYAVFISRSLVTASNSGDSAASVHTSLPAGSQLHRLSIFFIDSLTTL
jgi:hypothetical protein